MDELNEGLGGRIGGLDCALPTLALLLSVLLVMTTAGVVGAAEKKADGKPKATPAPIEVVKGDRYRMADTKMAERITRYADPANDQLRKDGSAATDAPKWTDVEAVRVGVARMPAKLLTKMTIDYPPSTVGSFYGDAVDLTTSDRIIFVAVEMARRLPNGAIGQQVEIGLAGDAATPVQVGTHDDARAGVETFSLSGLFSNGAYDTADTDVSGRQPGAELESEDYYNADSGVFGFYHPKRSTWYIVVPRADDTNAITVSVRSTTSDGQVIDRLDLPGGGHFVDLPDPTGGFKAKAGSPPLTCRSLETFSGDAGVVELSDVDATLIRYTAGLDASSDPAVAAELLGPAIEAMGPVQVALTAVGSEAEPLIVDGELSVSPAGNAASLTFEAPAGQWSFELADEPKLKTAAGESIIDHRSLTGTAGVQTGPGLDGFVAGDLSCVTDEEGESPT